VLPYGCKDIDETNVIEYDPVREQIMARKTSKLAKCAPGVDAPRKQVRTRGIAKQVRPDRLERLQPKLQPSELIKDDKLRSALSAHKKVAQVRTNLQLPNLEAILRQARTAAELFDNDQMRSALSAHQKVTEQVRAGLQLPNLEAISRQARTAAEVLSKHLAGVPSARDLARAAVSTNPALIEHEPVASSPLAEQTEIRAPFTAITSAHVLGQMVREEREKRKLSQLAFADIVGVGRRFISELENGKATLEFDKVLQVASATGIEVLARSRR
jgi:y4mF family transcriptional regulator